jgi:hypothetical protein
MDKDANVRLRALSSFGKHSDCLGLLTKGDSLLVFGSITRRLLDKSKTVRLKAFQTVETILKCQAETTNTGLLGEESGVSCAGIHQALGMSQGALFPVLTKLLSIPQDSPSFCKETLSAAARLLSLPCQLKTMQPHLEALITSSYTPISRSHAVQSVQTHLRSCDAWSSFLCSAQEKTLERLPAFLLGEEATTSEDGTEEVDHMTSGETETLKFTGFIRPRFPRRHHTPLRRGCEPC